MFRTFSWDVSRVDLRLFQVCFQLVSSKFQISSMVGCFKGVFKDVQIGYQVCLCVCLENSTIVFQGC